MPRSPGAAFAALLRVALLGAALVAPVQAAQPDKSAQTAAAAQRIASRAESYYHFALGSLLLDRGDAAQGEKELLRAAELDPTSSIISAELASFYLQDGRVADAVEWGQRAIRRDPASPEAHRVLGEALAASAHRAGSDGSEAQILSGAIAELETAVRLGGDDAETLVSLGRMLGQAGRDEEAVRVFERLIARWGDTLPAHLLLAKSLERANRKPDAVVHYRWILGRSPNHLEALSSLADVLEELERWDEASEAWGRIAGLRRGDAAARMKQGLALLHADQPERAVTPLRSARELDPDNVAVSRLLAMALSRAGEFDDAAGLYREMIEKRPGEITLLAEAAWSLVESGRPEEAIPIQRRAVELAAANPGNRGASAGNLSLDLARMRLSVGGRQASAGALEALAAAREYGGIDAAEAALLACRARFAGEDAAAAAAECRSGRLAYPDTGEFVVLESESLIKAGRAAEAARLLDALAAKTDDPDLILFASGVYERAGDRGRAISMLAAATQRFPKSDVVRLQYGAVLEAAGRRDEAKAQMRHAIDLNAGNHVALNYLGYMMAEAGESLDEALLLIERALSIEPGSGAYLDSLGWVLFRQGRAQEALDPLTRAARLLARDSTVREHLGDVLAALGRRDEAELEWRQALQLGGPASRINSKLQAERAEGRQ